MTEHELEALRRRLDALERERQKQLLDYAQWRGSMNTLVHSTAQRVGDVKALLETGIGRIEQQLREGFEQQAVEIGEVKRQTTLTNGSVRRLKDRMLVIETTQQVEDSAAGRRRVERRFTAGQLVAVGSATSGIVVATCAVLSLLHVL